MWTLEDNTNGKNGGYLQICLDGRRVVDAFPYARDADIKAAAPKDSAVAAVSGRRYGAAMSGAATISTIGDLIDHGLSMSAWCPKDGHRPVDLEKLAEKYGRDASYIVRETRIRITCSACGRKRLSYVISAR